MKKKLQKVSYFSTPLMGEFGSFSSDEPLIRQALVLVEGTHVDSSKVTHDFPAERIQRIADNTNAEYESGKDIPVLLDHNKSVESTVGRIDSPVEVRPITEEDLSELGTKASRLKSLVGKLGIFSNNVVLTAKKAIDAFVSNTVRTVSPGIDISKDVIRELSIVPIPAIQGLSLYSEDGMSAGKGLALTLEEAFTEDRDWEGLEEKFEELSDKFWGVICNIYKAPPEALQTVDPVDLIYQAIDDYSIMISDLLELPTDEEREEGTGIIEGSEMPDYLSNQQEILRPTLNKYSEETEVSQFAEFSSGLAKVLRASPRSAFTTRAKNVFGNITRSLKRSGQLAKTGYNRGGVKGTYKALNRTSGGRRLLRGTAAVGTVGAVGTGLAYSSNRKKRNSMTY